MRWLLRWWHRRQRAIDKDVLWPACKAQAGNLAEARQMMFLHAAMDPAWRDLSAGEVAAIIGSWR
jgi:hypothetical protein